MCLIPLRSGIAEEDYQQIVEQSKLIEKVDYLYTLYHRDLTSKNFSNIVLYFPGFRYKTKYKNYREYFSDRFNIIYHAKTLELAVIDLEINGLEEKQLLTIL